MEQSCSFMPQIRTVFHRVEQKAAPPPTTYRRNDPTNRKYRMRKRAPAQVYYCTQCEKHIKYPSKINEHMRKHTGERPYACPVCRDCFTQSHALKRHMMVHVVLEKPFQCLFCLVSFKLLRDKDEHEGEHMRIHTGEKPFGCEMCGMRFAHRTPMINHYRVQHMDDSPFSNFESSPESEKHVFAEEVNPFLTLSDEEEEFEEHLNQL
uniref:C2H2-type domain-containing protein n=1 Tax=Caenorhabditis japonica TaxID=281687 RepID=A0A8R1HW26_CAEJA